MIKPREPVFQISESTYLTPKAAVLKIDTLHFWRLTIDFESPKHMVKSCLCRRNTWAPNLGPKIDHVGQSLHECRQVLLFLVGCHDNLVLI